MQSTIKNRTIFCKDNLEILQGINTETIDLVYLDPPFNKRKVFTAPIGTSAEGASFKDIFTQEDVKDEWVQEIKEDYFAIHRLLEAVKDIEGRTSYNFCYLAYMAVRLIECHRVLKDTGSIYLHCDPTMSHYLKILLDCVCGEANFINEINWCYTGPGSPHMKQFNRKHDVIFWYSKGNKWMFNGDDVRLPYKDSRQRPRRRFDTEAANSFSLENILAMRQRGKIPEDWWPDIALAVRSPKERTGYPTQKPLALLERVIKASSKEGDLVLDPFCGCATTCVAAEKLNRQWIGVDISVKAYELVQIRIKDEVYAEGLLKGEDGNLPSIHFRTDPPQRTDKDLDQQAQKYVYVISHRRYTGEYKVGIASNVKSRLNSYQIGDPDREYTLEYSMLTPYYREVEAYIHAKFNNKHEWVSGALADIIDEMEKYKPQTSDLFNEKG